MSTHASMRSKSLDNGGPEAVSLEHCRAGIPVDMRDETRQALRRSYQVRDDGLIDRMRRQSERHRGPGEIIQEAEAGKPPTTQPADIEQAITASQPGTTTRPAGVVIDTRKAAEDMVAGLNVYLWQLKEKKGWQPDPERAFAAFQDLVSKNPTHEELAEVSRLMKELSTVKVTLGPDIEGRDLKQHIEEGLTDAQRVHLDAITSGHKQIIVGTGLSYLIQDAEGRGVPPRAADTAKRLLGMLEPGEWRYCAQAYQQDTGLDLEEALRQRLGSGYSAIEPLINELKR